MIRLSEPQQNSYPKGNGIHETHNKDNNPEKPKKPKKEENPTMRDKKQPLEPMFRTKLRLSEIERLIRQHRIIVPPPSRKGLITLCENRVLETAGSEATTFGWLVYEDSFWKWAREMDEGSSKASSRKKRKP